MKNLLYILICLSVTSSCSRKVYFLDANKVDYIGEVIESDTDLVFTSYYAGDAVDYLIFEMDLKNNSAQSIELSYRNIELHVLDQKRSDQNIVMNPLSSEFVINELEDFHSSEKFKKSSRDIENVFQIGINFFLIGKGFSTADAILYSMDVASLMLDDARAHKLLTGSIEEQKQYVNTWVLDHDTLRPGEEGSWDILFPRQLIEGPASFILELDGQRYIQEYRLFLVEEKVMR